MGVITIKVVLVFRNFVC